MEISTFKWVKKVKDPNEVVTGQQVVERHGVPLKIFRKYMQSEVEEQSACWGLPFTLLLVVSYATAAITHDESKVIRAVEDALEIEVEERAKFAFGGSNVGFKEFEDVNSIADFWSWLSMGLVPAIAPEPSLILHERYNTSDPRYADLVAEAEPADGTWLNYNRIVGAVRLQQERSGDDGEPCPNLDVLKPFYGLECVHGLGYELDPEMWIARRSSEPKAQQWLYITDPNTGLQALQEQLWELEANQWFDRHTRKVEVAIPVYNAEFGLHTLLYLNLFINRGGHIWKRQIPLSTYAQWYSQWYFYVLDIVWLLCVLYILFSELFEIIQVLRRSSAAGLLKEYLGFWNAFDWLSIICSVTIISMFIVAMEESRAVNDAMRALPPLRDIGAQYQYLISAYFDQLENCVHYVHRLRIAVAAFPIIIVVRLFKAFRAQPRLALVTRTMTSAATDLIHFGIVFFSVFLAFAVAGVMLFGGEVLDFGTLDRAFVACFRVVHGDFQWDEISKVGRARAATWLVLFIVVMVMMLVNMLIAIVLDHYTKCKEAAGKSETLWGEAFQSWSRWRNVRKGIEVPIRNILDAVIAHERAEAGDESDEEEVSAAQMLGNTLHPDDVIDMYRAQGLPGELQFDQAMELLDGAVSMYWMQNKDSGKLEDITMLTRQLEARSKELIQIARQFESRIAAENEVEALQTFVQDLVVVTDELRQEREAQRQEMENLRAVKRGLLLQLQICHPELDFGGLALAATVDVQSSRDPGGPMDAVQFEL
mmetsp:Transcript_21611/g.50472  ORF Transcript_21611/g.50472 Transcript_21611/m.50472 type:complete len:764 (-) Transcript_21611:21-2312(-)|eukprot:CAMPEP_0178382106 /NCGR_PEP_ID=MMETSP0689_2-20121128/6325_1 /TAXON_ID=160604 /ORGANISM="Amphidinium massartii, Strain CS-259" /LENGTH=763 /DNA_ID=CAMNT_0020002305 /DNA_START=156 /DNA_END=2447 /DNA_ORIENTATION=+